MSSELLSRVKPVVTMLHSTPGETTRARPRKPMAREKPLTPTLVPTSFAYYTVSYTCLHGTPSEGRGDDYRARGSTQYTGCPARVTMQVQQDGVSEKWYIQCVQEIMEHNHAVTPYVFDTYWRTSDLVDADLFATVHLAFALNVDPKLTRDHLGTTYTQTQWGNLMANVFDGADALLSLKRLLKEFCTSGGSRCFIIDDAADVLSGVVLQSSLQPLLFQPYGDTLVLDWTHNTTNMGYYLGSLIVTIASGKGVSVLDFLSSAQTHEMMEAVSNFFIEHNPGARGKLKPVVIDKDYKEWRTIETCFPSTIVVLCIFHVVKWFKFVITQSKYGFTDAIKIAVMKVLRNMVFAPDVDAFEALQQILVGSLDLASVPGHADVLGYMETYWYSCVDKWSYSGRGYIFTATNTTSNRAESYWNQFKSRLGMKQRVDHCFLAIFGHTASVLKRELGIYADYEAAKPVHEYKHAYVQKVLLEISHYAAKLVKKQWVRYEATSSKMSEVVVQREGLKRVVRMYRPDQRRHRPMVMLVPFLPGRAGTMKRWKAVVILRQRSYVRWRV